MAAGEGGESLEVRLHGWVWITKGCRVRRGKADLTPRLGRDLCMVFLTWLKWFMCVQYSEQFTCMNALTPMTDEKTET